VIAARQSQLRVPWRHTSSYQEWFCPLRCCHKSLDAIGWTINERSNAPQPGIATRSPKSKYSPLLPQDSEQSTCVPALAELLSDVVYKRSRRQRGAVLV